MIFPSNCTSYDLGMDWASLARSVVLFKNSERYEMFVCLTSFFQPLIFENTISARQIKMRNDSFEIKITSSLVTVEVMGFFWTMNVNAFDQFKTLSKSLNNFLKDYFKDNINFHLTRSDLKQDFGNTEPNYFRPPLDNYRMFETDYVNFSHLPRGRKMIDTGFKIISSHWEIGVYLKNIENEFQKNSGKKEYVKSLLKDGESLTRLETRLKSSRLCEYASYLLQEKDLTESQFCIQVLNEFYNFRRILIENPNDSNKSRWKEDERWKGFFILDDIPQIKFKEKVGINKSSITFFSTTPKASESKLINQLSDLNYKLKALGMKGIDEKLAKADELAPKRALKKKKQEEDSLQFNKLLESKGEIAS